MTTTSNWLRGVCLTGTAALLTAMSASSVAAPLNLSEVPLFLQESVAPLNMIVLGRDHKLYYEAYNDYSDLNDDDVLDLKYKPLQINYYGYFDSLKCYTHDGARFNPVRLAALPGKTCGGAGEWSGDFLNYLTTARIDALRKVLYGGFRSSDPATGTVVLERTHIPQDAHSWGKEYTSTAVDGYDIRQYTPYAQPSPAGRRHLFANTTLLNTTAPLLRVLQNRSERIWNWVSIERPVAGGRMNHGGTGPEISPAPTDISVRVAVCVTGLMESNCKRYPNGSYKPFGLLHEFGENDSMYFGLITGSYAKNTSGGVLRRPVSSVSEEINSSTGQFRDGVYRNGTLLANQGIITTLNRLRTTGFAGNYEYSCGWGAAARTINEGECQMWGNPVAEMMYESLRYFAGRGSATSTYSIDYGAGQESLLTGGGLPVASWNNPYGNSRPVCAKPFQTVVSDINPSYDTDQLPGTAFGSFTGDLPGLDVSALGQTMWNHEFNGSREVFIGASGGVSDGAPTPKTVTSFGNIRGLSPEEPTKRGGYYAASVAYHGHKTDLNSVSGDQKVSTFSVALASPLPKIEIPVGDRKITLVPFAKSVAGSGISASADFQPTNQIVDFYVDTLTDTSGRFRVNFEDVEQGADHDMDAIVIYEYTVVGNSVQITLTSEYAAGGITQHMGYVISGTTHDGIYLEVRDQLTGDGATGDVNYRLDTPPAFQNATPPAPASGTGTWADNTPLPFVATRTFTPGTSQGASLLNDPLWYAAKWGGFKDSNNNDLPDVVSEWDARSSNGNTPDGTPDNYFLVTNALKLADQLRSAFNEILAQTSSASSASVNSGSISSETRVYQAKFSSGDWTGQLLSYPVNTTTGQLEDFEWDAATVLPDWDARKIFTINTDDNRTPVAFRWNSLDAARRAQIDPLYANGATDLARAVARLEYLRGSAQFESSTGFRARPTKLGDIVASSPIFVGAPRFLYRDSLESAPYSAFRDARQNRTQVVYAGANDGMLHGFNAETGVELLAYIPSTSYRHLRSLSDQAYSHRYFVDGAPNMGDVFINGAWETVLIGGLNKGGQGIYALKVTNPATFSEANPGNTVLWEFTDTDAPTTGVTGDRDLGYTYSQPAIVKLQNGRWGAIFGNGFNNTENDSSVSTSGNAVLYIVDIATGRQIAKLDTRKGMAADPAGLGRPNGLATPAVVDLNGDAVVDYVYAGDLFGNMWKFDIRTADPNGWTVAFGDAATPLPLFTAVHPDNTAAAQSITSRPEVIRGPRGVGMMVLFGTGKFLETSDKLLPSPAAVQTYYGIFDRNNGTRVASRDELLRQDIVYEGSFNIEGEDLDLRFTSANELQSGHRGWYLDLLSPHGYNGERQVSNTIVRAGRVIFTTLIPDSDPCSSGGTSWLMELNALSGGRLQTTPFDVNNDGRFDDEDLVDVPGLGLLPVSGLQPDVGITPEPGILLSEDGNTEYKYNPGTSGEISVTTENPGEGVSGRQSWRQIR